MTRSESLRVLRRRRSVILAGIMIGLVVGWILAPGKPAAPTGFQATHALILAPGSDFSQLTRAVALARFGGVPGRVAARLAIDRSRLSSVISFETPEGQGALFITGRSADRVEAELLANATAEELIIELGGPKSPLRTLEPGVASPVEADAKGPRSHAGRALLLGAFGLFLGVAAAFGIELFDDRVRSKATAEDALGVPVVSEVPQIASGDRDRLLLGAEHSSFLEAYRRLRTGVVRWTAQTDDADGHGVIVVASATGGEGTTTTVAHLAATLGEIGRSVVVISADLRHPRLHLYFNKAREPGLTDVLRGAPDVRRLTDLNLATTTRGVRFVASGAPVRNPTPLLDRLSDYLPEARSLGDVVLVDAPPLLTTSDGADLARQADGVLLVVRAGRTSVRAAARCAELLERLKIPVIGAVLLDA